MASMWIHSFSVNGGGYFPTDMLRYDRCSPSTQTDVEKMDDRQNHRTVELITRDTKDWSPTADRWRSFGWEVITHTKRAY